MNCPHPGASLPSAGVKIAPIYPKVKAFYDAAWRLSLSLEPEQPNLLILEDEMQAVLFPSCTSALMWDKRPSQFCLNLLQPFLDDKTRSGRGIAVGRCQCALCQSDKALQY